MQPNFLYIGRQQTPLLKKELFHFTTGTGPREQRREEREDKFSHGGSQALAGVVRTRHAAYTLTSFAGVTYLPTL